VDGLERLHRVLVLSMLSVDDAFMVARLDPHAAVSGALVYPEAFWETDTVGLRGDLLRGLCPELFEA
jgi:hypothetical protein